MNRNHVDAGKPAESRRYTRTSPPLTEDEARAGIETLDAKIDQITAQLESIDQKLFASEKEFNNWRQRATGSLIHTKKDRRFLEKWLWDRKKDEAEIVVSERRALADEIYEQAKQLAEEIGDGYVQLFTGKHPPKDLADHDARLAILIPMKQELQRAFATVTRAWTKNDFSEKNLPGVKAPLQRLLSQVESEFSVMRHFRNSHQSKLRSDWRKACAIVLERALAEGIVLSPEEHHVYEQLQVFLRMKRVCSKAITRAKKAGFVTLTPEEQSMLAQLRVDIENER